jgi:hypothetical protein
MRTALRSAIIGHHDDTKPWVVAVGAAVGLYLISPNEDG